MRRVINFFVKHVVLVNLSILVILFFGVLAAFNLSSTFFPEQQPRFINVQAVYPGASPIEMEESIVLKIEDNVKAVDGVKEITSRTEEDRTTVTIEIETGIDPNVALQEIKNEVDRISTFPTGLEELTVSKEDQLNPGGRMVLRGAITGAIARGPWQPDRSRTPAGALRDRGNGSGRALHPRYDAWPLDAGARDR